MCFKNTINIHHLLDKQDLYISIIEQFYAVINIYLYINERKKINESRAGTSKNRYICILDIDYHGFLGKLCPLKSSRAHIQVFAKELVQQRTGTVYF
jgi:hypothetical protein